MKNSKTKLHMFLILLLLLALTGMVYIGTDSFQVREITIIGNETRDKADIIRRAGISDEGNMLKLDKKLIKERIQGDPYLELVSITTNYPHEVIIEIREKQAAAIIPYLNSYFTIDKECYILEITNDIQDIKYPLVQDVPVKSFVVGKKLVAEEQYKLNALMKILESLYDLELDSEVSEIIMTDPEDVYLMLTDGVQVRLGQVLDIEEKLLWLGSQEIKDTCRGFVGGILDLSAPSRPVFYSEES